MKPYTLIVEFKGNDETRHIHDTYLKPYNPSYGLLFTSSRTPCDLFVRLELEPASATYLALTLSATVKPFDDNKIITKYLVEDIDTFLNYNR